MIRTGVHFELAIHRLTELRLRQHAVHGLFDEPLRATLAHNARPVFTEAPLVPGMLTVDLLVFFPAGQLDLGSIDDDDVIAGVDERRIGRLVLTLEEARRLGGDSTEHLVTGVDDVPVGGPRGLRRGHEAGHYRFVSHTVVCRVPSRRELLAARWPCP